jgi:hypothetical protein
VWPKEHLLSYIRRISRQEQPDLHHVVANGTIRWSVMIHWGTIFLLTLS